MSSQKEEIMNIAHSSEKFGFENQKEKKVALVSKLWKIFKLRERSNMWVDSKELMEKVRWKMQA